MDFSVDFGRKRHERMAHKRFEDEHVLNSRIHQLSTGNFATYVHRPRICTLIPQVSFFEDQVKTSFQVKMLQLVHNFMFSFSELNCNRIFVGVISKFSRQPFIPNSAN